MATSNSRTQSVGDRTRAKHDKARTWEVMRQGEVREESERGAKHGHRREVDQRVWMLGEWSVVGDDGGE